MKYAIVVYCSDCSFGQDPMGCFEGGTDLLEGTWDSLDGAKNAGWEAVRDCGPWHFRVVPVYRDGPDTDSRPLYDSSRY